MTTHLFLLLLLLHRPLGLGHLASRFGVLLDQFLCPLLLFLHHHSFILILLKVVLIITLEVLELLILDLESEGEGLSGRDVIIRGMEVERNLGHGYLAVSEQLRTSLASQTYQQHPCCDLLQEVPVV